MNALTMNPDTRPADTGLDVLAAAQRLRERGEPFALVSVVRALAPTSARPGDKAVVTAEGIVHGWIGGGCAQPAVTRTVREALADGRARLIRIAPTERTEIRDVSEALGDVLEFGMSCHSGGTLELFVDPVLPAARLVVIGDAPVAVALAGLAPRVGFEVIACTPSESSAEAEAHAASWAPGAFVVVATQGRRDLQGLRAALAARARGVWFVASTRKAEVLRASLVAAGSDAAAVAAVVAPAGQPIGAVTPEEIALSVLAAVVAARRADVPTTALSPAAATATAASAEAVRARVQERLARARAAAGGEADTPSAPSATSGASVPATAINPLPPAAGGSCCGS
jgi:xanthine dehydrogenase accessory factor